LVVTDAAGRIVATAGAAGSSRNETSASGSFFDAFGGGGGAAVLVEDAVPVLPAGFVVVLAEETLDVEVEDLPAVPGFAEETVELTDEPALLRSRLTLSVTEET
jgi:hypothetical protein